MKATARNGRLRLGEPTDLPEGTEVDLVPADGDDLDEDERRRLHEALAESEEDAAAGRNHCVPNHMAVSLEFHMDQRVFAEDRTHDPAGTDPAVVETTYFMVPVRMSIHGAELLRTQTTAWVPEPILGLATHLVLVLEALRTRGAATCSVGGGTLHFHLYQGVVRLVCSYNKVEADVSLDELQVAFENFRSRVRDSLSQLVPELTAHPWWPEWFPAVEPG